MGKYSLAVTPTPAAIAELLDHPDRLIELFAVHNFRDVGGYPTADGRRTAWRKVFRADGLYRLTTEDIEALRFDLVNKLITTDLPLETIKKQTTF